MSSYEKSHQIQMGQRCPLCYDYLWGPTCNDPITGMMTHSACLSRLESLEKATTSDYSPDFKDDFDIDSNASADEWTVVPRNLN